MTPLLLAAALAAPCPAAVLVRRAAPAPVAAFVPALAVPSLSVAAPAPALSPAAFAPVRLAAPADAPFPAPLAAPGRAGRRDVSEEYRAAFAAGGRLGEEEMRLLRGHRVLFLGGFLSNQMGMGRVLDPMNVTGIGDYFDQSISWLRAKGVSVERVPLQTESSPEHNARIIARALKASDKPVLVLSHSKGGLDMLETLRVHPELRPKVRGWVAQQAPFRGSPVADEFREGFFLRRFSRWMLEKLGGSEHSMASLSTKERHAYMRRHAAEIRRIAKEVPILTFASFIPRQALHRDTVFRAARDRMESRGIKNDGLVPVKSTFLAGVERVVVEGLDHLLPISYSLRQSFDQVLHSRALLGMILRRGRKAP